MKGNKGVMIVPRDAKHLAKAEHWLMSRDKEFKEFHMPVNENETQTMLICELDLVDRILYKLSFPDKTEKVNVYC